MSLNEAYRIFMEDRKSYCEPKTIRYYKENVTKFIAYIEDECDVSVLQELTREHYVSYLTYLRSCDIKNTTIHTYMRAIRAFVNFCLDNEYMSVNITYRVKLPKSDAELKIPLSSREVDRIDSVFDLDEKGMRNYLILHCMLDMGLRRQEVINLKKDDINYQDKYLIINKSKNNKSRVVPVPDMLLEYIRTYIKKYNRASDYVFRKLRTIREQLSDETIKQMFQDVKKESGVDRLHPHLLRHTFASSYMLYVGDIYMLKVLLGHSKVTTTEGYVHIANQMKLIHYDLYKIDDVFIRK